MDYLIECINDSGKPEDVPSTSWIKKGKIYTPIKVWFHPIQNTYSVEIEEVKLNMPYQGFRLDRFKPLDINGWDEILKEKLEYAE